MGTLSFLWKCYIGLVFCTLALVLYPLFLIVLSRKEWKKISFRLFVLWSWLMRIICFYHIKYVQKARLPKGPYIIIANHSSYLDIFFMYSLLPENPFLFLGKSEILSYPIIGTYFRGLNIPVDRKNKAKAALSLTLAKKSVKDGWSIVIFPEGTIPDDENPKMIPFKAGAFKLAKSLSIPIVPVTFTTNYHLFSDPTNILGPAHPGVSRVFVHQHIPLEIIEELSEKELSALCFSIVNEPILLEHPYLKENN